MLSIIGCGNLNRRDDGIGVVVARRLRERLARHPVPGVRAFDCGTAGMEVMFAARGSDALLILDACRTGAPAGAIFEVPGEEVARERTPGLSLHDFRWDDALAVGKRIFGAAFPADVRVLLAEAADTGLGLELSASALAAVETLYQRALALAADHAKRRHAGRGEVEVALRRGAVHLSASVWAEYFDGHEAALLLTHERRLLLMPVPAAAGGLLIKQRNAKGDRSIDACEWLRRSGFDDTRDYLLRGHWDQERGGLSLADAAEAS